MGSQSDEAVTLQGIADDLGKVKIGIDTLKQAVADLTTALANQETTPAVNDALLNVQTALKAVDDDLPAPPVTPNT